MLRLDRMGNMGAHTALSVMLVLGYVCSSMCTFPIAVPWTQQMNSSGDGAPKLTISIRDPAAASSLISIATMATLIKCSTLDFYMKHGPDGTNGFHATLSRDGRALSPTDKPMVLETRHLWAFSNFIDAKQGRPAQLVPVADNLATFIMQRLLDPVDGSFYSGATRNGTALTALNKDFYDQTVPIFALAKYAATLGNSAALKAAKKAFEVWDAAVHDGANKGYADGRAAGNITVAALASSGVALKANRAKSLNTQLHALLMVMDLARADPSYDLAGARLAEMVEVLTHKMLVGAGPPATAANAGKGVAGGNVGAGPFVSMSCPYNWVNCSKSSVSYGLTAEYVWYVDAAISLLQRRGQLTAKAAAAARGTITAVGTKALAAWGYDPVFGGVYDQGAVGNATASTSDKSWWVQLESTLAFFKLWQITGDVSFLAKADKTMGFISKNFWDPIYGDVLLKTTREGVLLKELDCAGKVDPAKVKACGNKSSFHIGRATVQLWSWLLDEGVAGMSTCVA